MRLPPEVNRILYVRNLPFKISDEEMYEIFAKYGAIRQVRMGTDKNTKGTAFVVYEDIFDAKNALEKLTGFRVGGRYLVVLYYSASKIQERIQVEKEKQEVEELKRKYKVQI